MNRKQVYGVIIVAAVLCIGAYLILINQPDQSNDVSDDETNDFSDIVVIYK